MILCRNNRVPNPLQTPTGRAGLTVFFAVALFFGAPLPGDLLWESHFADEDAITNGSSVMAGSTLVTFLTQVVSDSDGGTFDLVAERSASFFSFESGTTGNHTGYLEMTFNNENNDPADYLELTMNFFAPVTNLRFSVLDIDGSPASSWDDGVEIFYNGINVRTDPSLYSLGSIVFLDNETYMDGFESGTTSAAANEVTGNINLDFGALDINSIMIRYRSTDDAVANPASQFIGISDLVFNPTAIPEPGGMVAVVALLAMIASPRRRTGIRTSSTDVAN